MPPNQRNFTKGRALQPDPNKSLFKFKLTWQPDQDGTKKPAQTWYSYDYAIEREMFPEGIDKDLRLQWKALLAQIWKYEDAYEYIKWLRPTVKDDRLTLFVPHWPEISEMGAAIQSKYGWAFLEKYVHMCGFDDLGFATVKRDYAKQPSNSPGRVDFKQFYGFKYIHRNDFIVTSLATGSLLKVDVYDNLMYHSENHLHTLHGRMQTIANQDPAPPTRGRGPQQLSNFLPTQIQ